MNDADGHGRDFGHLRGAVTPCSSDDLEAVLGEWPNKQRREYALATDGRGEFLQGSEASLPSSKPMPVSF